VSEDRRRRLLRLPHQGQTPTREKADLSSRTRSAKRYRVAEANPDAVAHVAPATISGKELSGTGLPVSWQTGYQSVVVGLTTSDCQIRQGFADEDQTREARNSNSAPPVFSVVKECGTFTKWSKRVRNHSVVSPTTTLWYPVCHDTGRPVPESSLPDIVAGATCATASGFASATR